MQRSNVFPQQFSFPFGDIEDDTGISRKDNVMIWRYEVMMIGCVRELLDARRNDQRHGGGLAVKHFDPMGLADRSPRALSKRFPNHIRTARCKTVMCSSRIWRSRWEARWGYDDMIISRLDEKMACRYVDMMS